MRTSQQADLFGICSHTVLHFCELLTTALTERQITQRDFAHRTRTPVTNLSEILAGRRKPPMKRLDCWLEVLEVPTDQREMWRTAAALAHAKPEVHTLVQRLESEVESLRQKLPGAGPLA